MLRGGECRLQGTLVDDQSTQSVHYIKDLQESGMRESEQSDTFAALEKREWAKTNVAKSYAQVFAKAADMVVPTLVKAVEARSGTEALDLCCGHGNVTEGLIKAGASVTGLDFSSSMLEMARSSVPEAKFVEGDAMALDFDDGTFDIVTIGFGIPHVPDPPRVFTEARRVLRPGGRLAFSVWCGPEVDTALGYVFGAIGKYGAPDIVLPPGPGANDYADPENAFPALLKAGFANFHQSIVASEWVVSDPGAPFDFFLEGTARGGALLRPQPPDNAEAIRKAVVSQVLERHGSGPEWEVPIPAVVTAAKAV
ncbi:methyltransferase domain-containing protein [Ruegeria sp. HKCCSP351]|uniref:methyltransferase domain-containing protein n=1 Tax=Ruegeria sp. HKCCSP351 TaxID=2794832 RepID=UPI001FD746EE|nr:methyltransferase domain-containing protein [Ruegeria sp. HKCCSP351]